MIHFELVFVYYIAYESSFFVFFFFLAFFLSFFFFSLHLMSCSGVCGVLNKRCLVPLPQSTLIHCINCPFAWFSVNNLSYIWLKI